MMFKVSDHGMTVKVKRSDITGKSHLLVALDKWRKL